MKQLSPEDFVAVTALLEGSGLLASDLEPSDMQHFVGLRQADQLVAVGGIEVYERSGLLRSIAVSQMSRGKRLGEAVVAMLERLASDAGVRELYLLTESATDFFAKHQYEVTLRDEVPNDIRDTAQFAELCPEFAVCMKKRIPDSVDVPKSS